VSLYEALTLVVSSVSTLSTVYIGVRQLRQNAPRPLAVSGLPAPYGPAPNPPGLYRPVRQLPTRSVATLRRPSVTVASLLLFVAAATHPLMVAVYYTIRFATAPTEAAAELSDEGVVDVLVFGGVAFLTALLGVFVVRSNRVAVWCVWVVGALALVLLCVTAAANVLTALAVGRPGVFALDALDAFIFGYVVFVLLTYVAAAVLLATARSRPGRRE
jgi:uncharacterized integral membrane protein